MINVLLVEDSRIARDIMISQIEQSDHYRLFAAIENAANAEIVCMKGRVDLVLMDVCTAEDESGLLAAARIKKNYPKIKVIITTSMPEYSFLDKARQAGCESFYYKEYGNEDLLDVCDRTMAGESVYPSMTPNIRIGLSSKEELTPRELEVIRELARGSSHEEIADILHISVNTVKYHIKNILSKTGYKNTMSLVADVVAKRLILPQY